MARQSMARPLHCPAGGEHRGNREKQPAVALMDPIAFSPGSSISLHPSLAALLPRLQLVRDCWYLLASPREGDRRERHLPRGEREPEAVSHAARTASTRDTAGPGRVVAPGRAAATSSPMPGPM